MSHHPTSQELADLRSTFPDAAHVRHPAKGAWGHEKKQGIGHTVGPRGNRIYSAADPGTEARIEAGRMRSRAFERAYRFDLPAFIMGVHPGAVQQGQALVTVGMRWYVAAWQEEREHGCPAWGAE